MAELGASTILDPPTAGRIHQGVTVVQLGDADPAGRCRLDAIMRFLQDVARADWADSGLDGTSGWLTRRILSEVEQWPRLDEELNLATWCSGYGGRWAERRTSIAGANGARVETVALWVQVDLSSGRPSKLSEGFHAVYGEAAADRRVSARTQLSAIPVENADTVAWPIRLADLDIVGHMNNAAQCAAFEEALDLSGLTADLLRVEVEFGASLERGSHPTLAWAADDGGVDAWLTGDDETATAARIRPFQSAAGAQRRSS